MLLLACRHDIYELNLRAVFELKVSTSSGPGVLIFERFAKSWPNFDHKSFKNCLEDDVVCSRIPEHVRNDMKMYDIACNS